MYRSRPHPETVCRYSVLRKLKKQLDPAQGTDLLPKPSRHLRERNTALAHDMLEGG